MDNEHDKVEALLNQAMEFKPEERAAFLAGACGGDHDLLHKVETLLSSNTEASGFMPDNSTLMEGATISEGPGSKIDRYKLLQQIGEGGMGVVYMAQQEVPVKRKVALKIIKLGMDTKNVVARFEAERQALAMMDHPNIARVLDGGATDTGRPYFVMELVQGVPITEFCDKNKLSAAERLELFMPVCQAIQSAHQKGIIHRDIKPSNVLVTLHHGDPMPKVIDFGIAKATNQKLTEKTLFTNYAQMIGTPAYMSPEQAEMSSMDVDTRTDVYSLGVLLYELLTGTTPFSSKRLSSMAYGEVQRIIAEEEPQKPSTRMSTMEVEKKTVTAKNRGIDVVALSKQFKGDIDWIVMKCLEKDRRRRYDTPQELVADLKRFLNNEPVSAAAPTLSYQFQKMARRYKAAFAAAAAIAAVFVIGASVATWQAVKATRAQKEADTERRKTEALLEDNTRLLDDMRIARNEAEAARIESDRRFYRSAIRGAQVARIRNEPGFRQDTEKLLKEASGLDDDIKNLLEMRNEAMAVMLTPYSDASEKIFDVQYDLSGSYRQNRANGSVAAWGDENQMKIYDLENAKTYELLATNYPAIDDAEFSWDRNRLVSTHAGGVVRIWRRNGSANWSLEREIQTGTGEAIQSLAVGTKGFVIIPMESDQLLHWQNMTDAAPVRQTIPIPIEKSNWRGMALSPDDTTLAVRVHSTREVLIWDLVKNETIRRLKVETQHESQMANPCFDPKGQYLAIGSFGLFQIYDTTNFELRFQKLDSVNWNGISIDFNAEGTAVVYGTNPAHIHLLDANQPFVTLSQIGSYVFDTDSDALFHGIRRDDAMVTFGRWPASSLEYIELIGHASAAQGVSFHPNEPIVATSSTDKTVRLWDLKSGKEIQRLEMGNNASEDPLFNPAGEFFVTALDNETGTVQLRHARTSEVIKEFDLGGRVYSLDFSESNNRLAICGIGVFKVWDYQMVSSPGGTRSVQLELAKEVQGSTVGLLTTIHLSPNGRYVACLDAGENKASGIGSLSRGVRIWDLQTGAELPHPIKVGTAWNPFDFIGRDDLMVVCGPEGGVEIWNYVTGVRQSVLPELDAGLAQLDVSSDGRYLAFAEPPRSFGVYDLQDNKLLFENSTLDGGAWQIRWNHDGTKLGIAEGNGLARVLDMTAIRKQLDELGLDWED